MSLSPDSPDRSHWQRYFRHGAAWPRQLLDTVQAASTPSPDSVDRVAAHFNTWPAAVGSHLAIIRPVPEWPADDAPDSQILRVATAALEALPGNWCQRIPEASAQPWPGGPGGAIMRLRSSWLGLAVRAGQVAHGKTPQLPSSGPECRLRILLVDNLRQEGSLGVLRLQCVAVDEDVNLALVPAPGSAFTPCTASFRASLDLVSSFLRAQLLPEPTRHMALAWDIHIPGKPLKLLDGPSASAAMALAALWLLQQHFRDRALHLPRALAQLEPWMLDRSGITAALSADQSGRLSRVGGIGNKAEVLAGVADPERPAQLFAHPDDVKTLGEALPAGLKVHGVTSLRNLAECLAQALDMSTPQRLLADVIQSAGTSAAGSVTRGSPLGTGSPTLQVAQDASQVHHLKAYALHLWSTWCTEGEASCFVPQPIGHVHTASGGSVPVAGFGDQGPLQWLRSLPALPSGRLIEAVLLRGGPGSGKSAWLRQLAAELCEDFVRRSEAPQGLADAELPVHVPLRHLPANQDPLDWLRRRMMDLYPNCQALHSLLRGDPVPNHSALKLRLLLDGLDELQHGAGGKLRRAKAVLQRLAFGRLAQLPPVLCTRGVRSFDDLLSGGMLAADLQAWSAADVRQHVQLRLQAEQLDPAPLLDALERQPWLMALCRTPFHAHWLCSQWRRYPVLLFNRAAFQRRLLRALLLRELDSETEQGVTVDRHPLFHVCSEALLSDVNRRALQDADAWHAEPPAPWPTDCGLLQELFAQALAQREAAALELPAPAGVHRHGPERRQPGTTPLVSPGLRRQWLQMVDALGLLAPGAPAGATVCLHPDWEDYLASVSLFGLVDAHSSAPQPASLPAALHAGRDFQRSDVAERDHQRKLADAIWCEPGLSFWADLFSQPLRLPRLAVLDGLRAEGYTEAMLRHLPDGAGTAPVGQWQQAIHQGIVDLKSDPVQCLIDLRAWGDHEEVSQRCGLDTSDWTTEPAAWRQLLRLLPAPLRTHVFGRLGPGQAVRLQQHQGQLTLRPEGALDRPLALALLGLDRAGTRARLADLLCAGLWMALEPALADLQRHLEGTPEAAWSAPDPVLQHLRRVLLLKALDAGPGAEVLVHQSGQWGLLDCPIDGLPPALQDHWHQVERPAAFKLHPGGRAGRDLRDRLQAAHMLGVLGDTLRYEPAPAATGQGLRLRAALWADVGVSGETTAFDIGTPTGEPGTGTAEQPNWPAEVPHLRAARLLVTVAEWRCFVAAGGYDPSAQHWRQAGAAALRWLRDALAREARYRPPALDDAQWGHALNPVTSITVYEAMAYAAWAAPMYTAMAPGVGRCHPVMRPPTEVEWEAAQRAQGNGRPASHAGRWVHRTSGAPDPLAFNHAATSWQQPSPVGVFSRAYSPAGLADGQGNVWEWCVNSLPDGPTSYQHAAGRVQALAGWDAGALTTPRAVRGGSFHSLAWDCRPANRSCANAEDGGSDIGLRLVQVWPGQRTG